MEKILTKRRLELTAEDGAKTIVSHDAAGLIVEQIASGDDGDWLLTLFAADGLASTDDGKLAGNMPPLPLNEARELCHGIADAFKSAPAE